MTEHALLTANNVNFRVGAKSLINNVSMRVCQGDFVSIIGPNGAGKTTLLNLIDGDNTPSSGEVLLNGHNIRHKEPLQLAQMRAVLPQLGHVPFAIKVYDIVALGREPYRYEPCSAQSHAVIAHCLEQMDISHLAHHHYATLSGGEQHRVQIARTLAQIYHQTDADLSGKILFLDEPTNHLDIRHQYALMRLLKELQKQGLTIVAVMHDLSLTLQFSDNICLLNNGEKVGDFSPDELVASDALSDVYQMNMNVKWDTDMQRYFLLPN